MLIAGLWACSNNDDNYYNEVPQPIITFITQYWPNPVIREYSHPSSNVYEIEIKNGPSLDFDGNFAWTEIDGNGMPLLRELLYDQLPTELYQYLESGSYLEQVFEVDRNARTYNVDLLNVDLVYDIATGVIRETPD